MKLGIYVHVPFCSTTCDFCSFYQEKPQKGQIHDYLEALELEFELSPSCVDATTVFFGGGTPSVLSAKDLERLIRIVKKRVGENVSEWSIEMAPSSVKVDKLKVLKELGVNRISLGVQSFDPVLLDFMGRQHSVSQLTQAYERIRDAGFTNVNLDLIFAFPGQTESQWERDLKTAVALDPEHISTYCLIPEDALSFFARIPKEKRKKASTEVEAKLFEITWDLLGKAGYQQYEIANYSKAGLECQHNLNTWKMQEWLGFGPAAASQFGGERYANPANLQEWMNPLDEASLPHVNKERLSPREIFEDTLIFGLRMNEGVKKEYLQSFGGKVLVNSCLSFFKELVKQGVLLDEGQAYRLTDKGRLLADSVAVDLMCVFDEAEFL